MKNLSLWKLKKISKNNVNLEVTLDLKDVQHKQS